MDERQKTRLIVLGVSGVMMGAAYYGYSWYQEQKAAQAEEEQASVPVMTVRQKPAATQIAATTPVGATPAAGAGAMPAATKGAVDALPPPPITSTGTDAAPVVAQLPPMIGPPVVPPAVKVPVTVKPVTAVPAATQATPKPPVSATPAKPPVAPAPTTTPVTTTAKTQVPTPPAVAAKPAPAPTPAAAKPAPTPPPVAAQPPVTKPAAVAAVRPTPAPATTTPATTTPAPTTADAATTPAPAPAVTAASKELYLATTMDAATAAAKVNKGSAEPTRPVEKYPIWPPVRGGSMLAQNKDAAALMALVPPPPESGPPKPKKINEKLMPPPPPPEATGANSGGIAGLPIDQLPVPPSRPTIGDKVKIVGVFDDRAILAFPKQLAIKNKWPKTITLGTGDQFESLTIVSVNRDGVTIEEDGERTMKPIGTVK